MIAKQYFLKRLPVVEVPLRGHNLVGIPALRKLIRNGEAEPVTVDDPSRDLPPLESLSALVDDLVQSGRGVIMTMGKGGVGKTTVAAAIATELARRGLPVHLSTTDPAAHVAAAAGEAVGLERFQAAAEAGFRFVEYQYPYDWAAGSVAAALAASQSNTSPCAVAW